MTPPTEDGIYTYTVTLPDDKALVAGTVWMKHNEAGGTVMIPAQLSNEVASDDDDQKSAALLPLMENLKLLPLDVLKRLITEIDDMIWDEQFAATPDEVWAAMAADVQRGIKAGTVILIGECALLSQAVLAKEWDTPEEDAAWADL